MNPIMWWSKRTPSVSTTDVNYVSTAVSLQISQRREVLDFQIKNSCKSSSFGLAGQKLLHWYRSCNIFVSEVSYDRQTNLYENPAGIPGQEGH
jgi:hypothetical protein